MGVRPQIRDWVIALIHSQNDKNLNAAIVTARALLLVELDGPDQESSIHASINGSTDSYQLSALVSGLAAAAGKVSDRQAKVIADTLLAAIKDSTDYSKLDALGWGLAAVAERISDAQQAKAIADTLLAAVKDSTNYSALDALGPGLAAAAGKVSETQAKALADTILAAIKGSTDPARLYALGRGLAAIAGRISDTKRKRSPIQSLPPSKAARIVLNSTLSVRVWRR